MQKSDKQRWAKRIEGSKELDMKMGSKALAVKITYLFPYQSLNIHKYKQPFNA